MHAFYVCVCFILSNDRHLETFWFCHQVQLFLTLATLYRDMHMFRKAAFYSRIAAMQFVSPANRQPSWHQCYNFLIRALPGYQLSLDPKEMLSGWF